MIACAMTGEGDLTNKIPREQLVIMAASSLTDVLPEIGRQFNELHPNIDLSFNFDGSQRLRTQLILGASADVFISADWKQTKDLEEARLTLTKGKSFAHNKLSIITHENFRVKPDTPIRKLKDLAAPGIKLVLANNNVPAGRYTRQLLEDAENSESFGTGFKDKVMHNLISNESNVRSIVQKVSLGEADAGVVYHTDVKPNVENLKLIAIPTDINITTSYPVVILKDSTQYSLAQEFVAFLYSDHTQNTLLKYGFDPTNSAPLIE